MTGTGFIVGWRQVAICFVLLAADAILASAYGVMAVPLGAEFHPSRMVLMLSMTILSGGTALLAPGLGILMDRIAIRQLMILGGLFLVAGYVTLSYATSFTQVLIIYGVLFAPANVLIGPVAATVLISRWFMMRRGTAIGIAIAGIATGGVVFPPVLQWLLNAHEWREALRLFALIAAAVTLPTAALIVNAPADRGLNPDGAAEMPAARSKGSVERVSARFFLSDPTFWLAAVIFSTTLSGMKGMVTNLSPLAIDVGVKASEAAWLVSIYSAGGFIGKLSFAAVADRLNPRTLMYTSLGGFGCGITLLSQAAKGYWMIAAAVGVIGLFGGLMVPLQSFLMPRIYGERVVGQAMGLISALTLCALLATPPLFGLMFDMTGSYSGICFIFTGLSAAAILLARFVRLTPRPESRTGGEGVGAPQLAE